MNADAHDTKQESDEQDEDLDLQGEDAEDVKGGGAWHGGTPEKSPAPDFYRGTR